MEQKKRKTYLSNTKTLESKVCPGTRAINDRTFLLSFNYTNPFTQDHFISTNVHGLVGDQDGIILGIDMNDNTDDSNLVREAVFFSKTLRKLGAAKYQSSWALPNKESVFKIVLYGHSLSKADYSYFQSIFDFYDIYNGTVDLRFFFSKYGNKTSSDCRLEQQKSITDLLDYYSSTISRTGPKINIINKLLLENRIHLVEIE